MSVVSEKIMRDEDGRPVAEDGYPMGGLASISEVATASSLSVAMIYKMISGGDLECRRIGRSVRIPWSAVREAGLV